MKIKRLQIDDLDKSLTDYRMYKSKIDRLHNEVNVQKGKLQQIQKDLEDAEKAFDKEKRKIYSIIEDLYADEPRQKD